MKIPLVLLVFYSSSIFAQATQSDSASTSLEFYIGKEVTNAEDKAEKQIIQLWKNYLLEGNFQDPESPFWSFEQMVVPDEYLWAVGVNSLNNRDYKIQCKIIGIFPVENNHFCLVSSFMHTDEKGEIHLDVIPSVYAKKVNGAFLLISSAEYHKRILEHHKIGTINYYVHPFHVFNKEEAERMNQFNQFLAEEFAIEPIEFDYFVANSARDITDIWGYEYMDRMYNPAQTGGVASLRNQIIYSGNNSEYFPHELVHLYAYKLVPKDTHLWIAEGIATFYGGKTGYSLDWHLEKLRLFLENNPNYDLSDINQLKDIPNGEHISDFRYIIGGLLMKKIYAKEGAEGLIEALHIEGRNDILKNEKNNDDFFQYLNEKLGIKKDEFDTYIRTEVKKLKATK